MHPTSEASTTNEPLGEDDHTEAVERLTPEYENETQRQDGDRLARIYAQRQIDPSEEVENKLLLARMRMRKGPRLHPGEFLQDGRYRLLHRIESSSTAEDWKAWDNQSIRLVQIQVFYDFWVSDEALVSEFEKRGASIAALSHPGIAKVLEAKTSPEGFVYLARQYYDEGTLADAVAMGLPLLDAIQSVLDIAEAAEFAHMVHIIHGAIRPENIMRAPNGAPHLVQFAMGPNSGGMGSLFEAPESARRNHAPAITDDVYAIGMTALYILNGGELPMWVLRDPGRLIEQIEAPNTIKEVIHKCIDWDLQERYGSLEPLFQTLHSDLELIHDLANRAREIGRYRVAGAHFDRLLAARYGDASQLHRTLGEIRIGSKEWQTSHHHLTEALKLTKDPTPLFPSFRRVAEATGEWGRYADTLWSHARKRPKNERVLLRTELAEIQQRRIGDPTSAKETWNQVLTEHRTPDQAQTALQALRELSEERSDWRSFADYAERLLPYLPSADQPELEYALGRAYLVELENIETGLAWIERAEEKGAQGLDLAPRLIELRSERGEWKKVIRLMLAQAEGQPLSTASPTLLRAGIIATGVHLEHEAFEVYHTLLSRAPRHVVALRHLARLHHRAREVDAAKTYYQTLWDAYLGQSSQEPEASERAADCTGYAELLLAEGDLSGAIERLDEALRLCPDHLPALQLAGPLYFGQGKLVQAQQCHESVLRLFRSVSGSPQAIEASVALGDLAWSQGRLTAAMGWYNRTVDLDPHHPRAWFGLAKVALSSRGGHPGAERAPWVSAIPVRFTFHEALVRLLCGVLDKPGMERWLEQTAVGRSFVSKGNTTMRVAFGTVDLLVRNQLITPEFFERLLKRAPDWRKEVEATRALFFGSGHQEFAPHTSYNWSSSAIDRDFDANHPRTTLPPRIEDVIPPTIPLKADHLDLLMSGPPLPAPSPPPQLRLHVEDLTRRIRGPIGAFVRDNTLWGALLSHQDEMSVGSGEDDRVLILDDERVVPALATLKRQGGYLYLDVADEGIVQVDGEARSLWRLNGGERVRFGDTRVRFQTFEAEEELPKTIRNRPSPTPTPKVIAVMPLELDEPSAGGPEDSRLFDDLSLPMPELSPGEVSFPSEEESDDALIIAGPARVVIPEEPKPEPEPDEVLKALRQEQDSYDAESEMLATQAVFEEEPEPEAATPKEVLEEQSAPGLQKETSAEESSPNSNLESESALVEEGDEDEELWGEPEPSVDGFASGDYDDDSDEFEEEDLEEEEEEPPPGEWVDEAPPPPPPVAVEDVLAAAEIAEAMEIEEANQRHNLHSQLGGDFDEGSELIPTMPPQSTLAGMDLPEDRVPPPFVLTEEPPPPSDFAVPLQTPDPLLEEHAAYDLREEGAVVEDEPNLFVDEEPEFEDEPSMIFTDIEEEPSFIEYKDPENEWKPIPVEQTLRPMSPNHSHMSDQDVSDADEEHSDSEVIEGPMFEDEPATVIGMASLTSPTLVAPTDMEEETLLQTFPEEQINSEATLEFVAGADRGNSVTVGHQLTIGQSRHCGLSIPQDSRLSPIHCRIDRQVDGRFLLKDVNSANGTVVNGSRISEIVLRGGEVIMVGRTVLRFRVVN